MEAHMRTLLAIVSVLGSVVASDATAQADRKRAAKPRDHAAQHHANPKANAECERARHEDPTGSFAAYPCWAREAFARGSQGNRE
jgi:Ni/Co efflux regulator RcnB